MASIASGQNCFIWDNIYLSQCPCEIILGLVSTEAQTGNYQKKLLIFKCLILDKSGCLSIMLEYRGNPTKSTAIATFPPTVVYLTSSIKRYSSASIVKKKRLSRRARANIGWSRQRIRLYLIVLEEGRLYPPAMIRTFFKRNSIQCTYNSSQI